MDRAPRVHFRRQEIAFKTIESKRAHLRVMLRYLVDMRLLRVKKLDPQSHFKNYVDYRIEKGYKLFTIKHERKIMHECIGGY